MTTRYTVEEAAAEFGRHPMTIYKALESKALHGLQKSKGGRWIIREDCAEAWAAGQQCEHQRNVVEFRRAS